MSTPIPADIPVRPTFWNVPLWGEIAVYVLGIAAVAAFIYGASIYFKKVKMQKLPEDVLRRKRIWEEIVLQKKVRQTTMGRVHFALVVGFFLLFLGTAAATLDWDVGHYVLDRRFLTGEVYLGYKLVLDLAGAVVLFALLFGILRRFYTKNSLPKDSRYTYLYISLAAIIFTGFMLEGMRLAVQNPAWIQFSPVGELFAKLYWRIGFEEETMIVMHKCLWFLHGLASIAFIAAAPLTLYSHVYRTPMGIAARRSGSIKEVPMIKDIEEQEEFGTSRIEQFNWQDRISMDACVECGRCTDVCPAVRAGTPLNPKNIVLKLRERAEMKEKGQADDKNLVGDVVTREELFSCTTCGACQNACPADIPTPLWIVEMRRHLALECGEFAGGAAEALENTATVGNPWGLDPSDRTAWTKDVEVPFAEPGKHYDYLYWVGCAASYDRRAAKVARSFCRILNAAGVNYAVMREERCHAEFARRMGEEYLYQTAAAENAENFANYDFDKITTACPHCMNTLKNEYPQLGMNYEVVDHATLIADLIKSGRISVDASLDLEKPSTTIHDPCYLARHNGVVEAPRNALSGVGVDAASPVECGSFSMCCGAGGGRMWSDERLGKKQISIIRIEALEAGGAKQIATACPHCLTMLESARSTQGRDDVKIRDIAEIVAERIKV